MELLEFYIFRQILGPQYIKISSFQPSTLMGNIFKTPSKSDTCQHTTEIHRKSYKFLSFVTESLDFRKDILNPENFWLISNSLIKNMWNPHLLLILKQKSMHKSQKEEKPIRTNKNSVGQRTHKSVQVNCPHKNIFSRKIYDPKLQHAKMWTQFGF